MGATATAVSAAHAVAAGAVFAYLHLFRARGCACVTERADFCRLYVAAAALFAWRAIALAMQAAGAPRPSRAWLAASLLPIAAFFAFFARFAYDVWLRRALFGGAPPAECACATEGRAARALGVAAFAYGAAMLAGAAAALALLAALR